MDQNWGGSTARLQRRAPHTSVPRAAPCPPGMCLGTCCSSRGVSGNPPQLWQVFAPPQAPLLFGGAGTSTPLCGPGGDGSLWLDPGHPLPCAPLPSCRCSPSQGLCWGQGWLHPLRCPLPWLADPPFGHMSPGELCLSLHPGAVARPLAGTHKLWCSRLRIHYCFQTAAKGWAGGVPQSPGHLKTLRAPHCMETPVWSLLVWLWGWGGLAPGACQAGLRVPRGLRMGLWAPKTTGDHPKLPGGHGELGVWGSSLSPFNCRRGAAIWGPRGVNRAWGAQTVPCDTPRSVSSPSPSHPQCLCVSSPEGELSPCEVCVSREWVVAAPVNKTAS